MDQAGRRELQDSWRKPRRPQRASAEKHQHAPQYRFLGKNVAGLAELTSDLVESNWNGLVRVRHFLRWDAMDRADFPVAFRQPARQPARTGLAESRPVDGAGCRNATGKSARSIASHRRK